MEPRALAIDPSGDVLIGVSASGAAGIAGSMQLNMVGFGAAGDSSGTLTGSGGGFSVASGFANQDLKPTAVIKADRQDPAVVPGIVDQIVKLNPDTGAILATIARLLKPSACWRFCTFEIAVFCQE